MENHLIKQAELEHEKKGQCPACGGEMDLVSWCLEDNCTCDASSCPANLSDVECLVDELRLKCRKCGAVVETE